ncbi:maestro heat-like repeat-containing protein family member 2A [Ditylenchus destructor]|nr:maestro heat-like repeat-containing protein family member 2A [Ditylenchus destructor]
MAQNLEDLINALFDAITNHPSPEFYDTVTNSLSVLGTKQPALFLSAAHAFILQHNKLIDKDRAFLLRSITKVLEGPQVVEECDEQQGLLIINLATQEMTLTKDHEETWANSAKDVLVILAKSPRFVSHVMESLLHKFTAGLATPPHKYITLTLAAVAHNNAIGFIQFLTDILSRTVPLLPHLKQDLLKSAWSQAICNFCEAVLEYSSSMFPNTTEEVEENGEEPSFSIEVRSMTNLADYADQLESVYDVVFGWTNAKDPRCRADAVECVGTLCLMISKERINKDMKKLVTMFLSLYKKTTVHEELFAMTKGMANFLEACCSDEILPVEHYLDDIFNAFFPHVCVVTEQSLVTEDSTLTTNAVQIKIRNEAFRCFNVASRRFADRQVYYLLHKMQSDKDSVKLGATNLMRHLLNSAGSQMEEQRALVTMGLKPLLTDETLSPRVKMSVCQLCVALADHGYVHPDAGGEHVIKFLLTNLVLKSEAIISKKQSSINPPSTEAISLNQLHLQCAQALHTIANTCDSAYTLLWPFLFEFLCSETYTPVIADLFKCLRILMSRTREAGQKLDFVTGFDTNAKLAGPHQVLARIFACLNGAPLSTALLNRATEALKVLDEIGVWFNEAIPAVLREHLPQLFAILEEEGIPSQSNDHISQLTTSGANDPSSYPKKYKNVRTADYSTLELRCARNQRWQAHCLDLLNACICVVNNGEWRQAIAAAQAQQLKLYNDNSHDKAFVMRTIGMTLSKITNTSFVVAHAQLLFRDTMHSNQAERVGCAMAVGLVAQSHTDLMLTELENVAKWEHMKKTAGSAGLLSFIKDAAIGKTLDVEVIHLRATLVLSYGYVVFYCPVDMVVQRLEQTVLPFLRQYMNNCKEVVMKEAHLETINLVGLTVSSSHLGSDYKFDNRLECFSYIKNYLQSEEPAMLTSWIRLLAAKATATLVQLDPPISENELKDLGSVLTSQIFPMAREKAGLKTLDPLSVSAYLLPPFLSLSFSSSTGTHYRSRVGSSVSAQIATNSSVLLHSRHLVAPTTSEAKTPQKPTTPTKSKKKDKAKLAEAKRSSSADGTRFRIEDDEASTVMDATVMQYRNAISHIVARQPFVESVSHLLKVFWPSYGSTVDHERARAIDSTVLILHVYSENAADCTLGRANDFGPLPNLLSRLCPRLADSYYAVRLLSIRAIWLSFKLSLLHRGHSPQDTDLVDSALFDISAFIDEHLGNEGKMDQNKCRSAISAISKEVEQRLPQSQVQLYLSVLFNTLADPQSLVSSSAAQLLSVIISDRGQLLHAEAEILVTKLLEHLAQVNASSASNQTYAELLDGFNLFAAHQQNVAIDVLLKQPLPYSRTNLDVWQMMAKDKTQFSVAADYILDLMGAGQMPPPSTTPVLNPTIRRSPIEPVINSDASNIEAADNDLSVETESVASDHTEPAHQPRQNVSPAMSRIHSPPPSKQHYEIIDVGGGVAVKVVSSEACALTAAMQELVKSGEPEDALSARIPLIIAAFLQILAAVVDTQYPTVHKPPMGGGSGVPGTDSPASTKAPSGKSTTATLPKAKKTNAVPIITSELCRVSSTPANLVSEALKTLLSRIGAKPVIETMNSERAWSSISHPQHFITSIATFCRSLCDYKPKFVGPLMYIMASRIDSSCIAERVAAAACLSALITRCPKENGEFDATLLDVTFRALNKALNDPKLIVRKLSIRGHGHISQLGSSPAAKLIEMDHLVESYSQEAVEAALVGLDDSGDRSDQLAIEAVDALDSLVAVADVKLLTQILAQLLLKIRPCFEKENPPLRAAAFSLFAGLGLRVGESENFRESLHANIISVLLHLNDTDEAVQQKCSHVLCSTSRLLNSEHAVVLMQQHLVDNKPVANYSVFIKDFSLILAVSFPDRLNYYALNCSNYFKSQSPRIRQNAALMTGHLLAALSPELRGTLSKDLIFSGLVQLLKDTDEAVRIITARAISFLHAYA